MSPSYYYCSSSFIFTITIFLILVSLTSPSLILDTQNNEQSQAFSFCEQVKNDKVFLKEDINQAKHQNVHISVVHDKRHGKYVKKSCVVKLIIWQFKPI